MKYVDLEDNEFTISLGSYVSVDTKRPRSKLHLVARQCLKGVFPTITLTEEVPIRIKRRKTLYLDFYIPLLNLAVEVHGEQHFKYSSMFHSSTADFLLQKQNDTLKLEWCERNDIQLLILPYSESAEEWQARLSTRDLAT